MRRIAVLLLCVFLCTACGADDGDLTPIMQMRQNLNRGINCSFQTEITADYGDGIYVFSMDCIFDAAGDLRFEVVKPDTISGISGIVSQSGGKLEFDDQVVLFSALTQGEITPIIAPWLMMNVINSGYISGVNDEKVYTIKDTFKGEELLVLVTLQDNASLSYCEIFCHDRCVLSLRISDFCFL